MFNLIHNNQALIFRSDVGNFFPSMSFNFRFCETTTNWNRIFDDVVTI